MHKPMRVIARVENVACPDAAHAMTNRFMKVGSVHTTTQDFAYVCSLLKSGEVWPADEETAIRASDSRVMARWIAVKPHVERLIAQQKADEEKAAADAKKAAEEQAKADEKAAKEAEEAFAKEVADLGALIAPQPQAAAKPAPAAPSKPSPKAGE